MPVLQLHKILHSAPKPLALPGIGLRTYRGREDIPRWLELRRAAFADQEVGVRDWGLPEFERELLGKPWWEPDRLWFAEQADSGDRGVIGSVTLAFRGSGANAMPAVHWLMVDPLWRRRGVGRLLMTALEAEAWDLGFRKVCLETHAGWHAAVHLYRRLGYLPAESARKSE